MKVTIELPETFDVTSREQTATFGLESVPNEKRASFYAAAALHGLKQAIADSAASAASQAKAEGETRSVEQIALDNMQSKIAGFASGEWSQRRESAPADPVGARAFKIALDWIRADARLKAKYSEADADGKKALRKAVFEKFEDKLRAAAKKAIEAERKQAEEIDLSDF